MTTRYPRLQVTIDPELGEVLELLSVLVQKPQATIVRELLNEAAPAMAEMAVALQQAKAAPRKGAARMAAMVERHVVDLQQLGLELKRKPGRPRKRG